MTQLTDAQIQRTIDTCREHLVEIADSFRTALGCEIRLSAGEPSGVGESGGLGDFQAPGLAIAMVVGEQGLILLIPQTLPLPNWYRQPDISQNNRLQTFAHELSLHVLPADLQSERYAAIPTENLIEVAQSAQAAPTAKMVELAVFHSDGTDQAAFAKILLIVPVVAPPVPAAGATTGNDALQATAADRATSAQVGESTSDDSSVSTTESQSPDEGETDAAAGGESHDELSEAAGPLGDESQAELDSVELDAVELDAVELDAVAEGDFSPSAAASADAALRALRILRVPVTVSVRLAERKMGLGAVVALVPGSLVTFSKSCEDLLDLYVNNHRYCQGEAIKIGESFGLKVSKVGVMDERRERIV